MSYLQNISKILDIAAIIVGNLSLLGIVITLWFNYRENRTNRYVQIVTTQTLANNNYIRKNSAIFATLTKPAVIDEARKRNDLSYKYRLIQSVCNMEVQFKHIIPEERKLINCARNLSEKSIKYFDAPTKELRTTIINEGNEYYKLMTVYDYADWQYIKSQARTKAYNKGLPQFEALYQEQQSDFNAKELPRKWSI